MRFVGDSGAVSMQFLIAMKLWVSSISHQQFWSFYNPCILSLNSYRGAWSNLAPLCWITLAFLTFLWDIVPEHVVKVEQLGKHCKKLWIIFFCIHLWIYTIAKSEIWGNYFISAWTKDANFADHIFNCIWLKQNGGILIDVSLKYIPMSPIE